MNHQGFHNKLSGIFSNSQFRRVCENSNNPVLDKNVKNLSGKLRIGKNATRKEILNDLYRMLLSDYRCEYVYKNMIARKILLGRHRLNSSVMLNEFRVGSSLADTVIFNGSSTVYEIKTELDSPERLADQIRDYRKAFPVINLVVHHTQANRYLSLIKESSVGLIALTRRNQLSIKKQTVPDYQDLDICTMFKSLRKSEYSQIIREKFGSLPDVPNMFYFRECLKLARIMDAKEFCSMMNNELKKRKPKVPEMISSGTIPEYLTGICLALNPTRKQYERLFSYLNEPVN